MIRNIIKTIVILLLIGTSSCIKSDFKPAVANNAPIVQSFLYAHRDSVKVTISKLLVYSADSLDTVQKPISNLRVYVNDTLVPETSAGMYAMKWSSPLREGATYALRFEYNNNVVNSKTIIPTKPTKVSISDTIPQMLHVTKDMSGANSHSFTKFTPPTISWENSKNDYHYVIIEYLEPTFAYTNDYVADIGTKTRTYTSRPNQDAAYTIGQRELMYYGHYRLILCRINKEYYDLYQTSTTSSNNISNAPTNLTNAWGLFTGVSTDTVYFRTHE